MTNSSKKELIRTIKYLLCTASAGIIQFGSNAILLFAFPDAFEEETGKAVFYAIGLVLSVIWNFTFNRKFTFKSADNIKISMLKVFAYYVVFGPASYLFDIYLISIGVHPLLSTSINMLINVSTELPYQRFFVFGKTIDTNNLAKKETENKVEE